MQRDTFAGAKCADQIERDFVEAYDDPTVPTETEQRVVDLLKALARATIDLRQDIQALTARLDALTEGAKPIH